MIGGLRRGERSDGGGWMLLRWWRVRDGYHIVGDVFGCPGREKREGGRRKKREMGGGG